MFTEDGHWLVFPDLLESRQSGQVTMYAIHTLTDTFFGVDYAIGIGINPIVKTKLLSFDEDWEYHLLDN